MNAKKVAIIQSNYIPWKGYFDIINSVDEFILFDDVQYTRRDWRNRNLIKTNHGPLWLTIPVNVKSNFSIRINEVEVADKRWGAKHWASISANYSKSLYFKEYKDVFEPLFHDEQKFNLSSINFRFIQAINQVLGIRTKLTWSTDYHIGVAEKNERLVSLCQAANATEYLSGPAAKDYIDESKFTEKKILLRWMDYQGYREYNQLFPPFSHNVTILDLLFNTGKEAPFFMKSFQTVSS